MRQTFSNSKVSGQTRSLSEENVVPNMPRNDDDDDDESDNDPTTSSTSRDRSRPHIATHHSRNPTFSMQVDRLKGNSNPSNLGPYNNAYPHHSYSDSSENNGSNKPPPVSTSSRSTIVHRTINGNFYKRDTSVHQTNISSHNVEDNTIINSFNNNSKRLCRFLFLDMHTA